MATEQPLFEVRCPNDGQLLFKADDLEGVTIEIKCRRCGTVIEGVITASEREAA